MSRHDPPRPSRTSVAVLGAGAWGSVLAALLGERGHDVRLWDRDPDRAARWERDRRDPLGRTVVTLPGGVRVGADPATALAGAEVAFAVVPNAALGDLCDALGSFAPAGLRIVSCSKGLFAPDLGRPSGRLGAAVDGARVAVLSGPNLVTEIAAGLPAAATVAAASRRDATRIQRLLTGPRFRVYVGDDPLGLEVAGAYKNVIALAAGMADALGLGENAKAALIARGLAETVRLGRHLGARARTFYGLAGVGDLVATCASGASRNHRAGERLATGATAEALRREGLTAEGLGTVAAVAAYGEAHELHLPIARRVHAVAYDGEPARAALDALLAGDPGDEWEDAHG